MKVTILGCGASAGVPLIGCDCSVCTSDNPKNARSRASIMIESQGARLLVDTSPDIRTQALRAGVKTVDAILYTHAHADHTHGLDDVRAFNYHTDKPIPAYMDQATYDELMERFGYAFLPPKPEYGWFRPCLEANVVQPFERFMVKDMTVQLFQQCHGSHQTTLGVRVGDVAYSTDVTEFPEDSKALLQGLDLWIVDCLQFNPAPTHAHLDLALEWIAEYQPKQAILTHMSHVIDYDAVQPTLPDNVQLAYDNMVVDNSA